MKKYLLSLVLILICHSLALAQDSLPPIPEGFEGPPPGLDAEQLPTIPDLENPKAQGEQNPGDLENSPQKPVEALKLIDKVQPTPTVVTKSPTAVPTVAPTPKPEPAKSSLEKGASVPTSLPTQEAIATPVVQKATTPSAVLAPAKPVAAIVGSGLSDYFPTGLGTKWTYEYLKAAASGVKKTRVVECTEAQQFPNGTIRATFKVTEGVGITENYSIHGSLVQRTSSGDKTLDSDFVFKFPKAAAPSAWTAVGVDGISKSCSASFGKAQVYQKTYPDCVVVKEKTTSSTILSYYAKGLGLVAVEVYGPSMKLLLERSFALIGEPTR